MNKKILWIGIVILICCLMMATGCRVRGSAETGHIHGPQCGHYYWHEAWHDVPHPAHCELCISHGIKLEGQLSID